MGTQTVCTRRQAACVPGDELMLEARVLLQPAPGMGRPEAGSIGTVLILCWGPEVPLPGCGFRLCHQEMSPSHTSPPAEDNKKRQTSVCLGSGTSLSPSVRQGGGERWVPGMDLHSAMVKLQAVMHTPTHSWLWGVSRIAQVQPGILPPAPTDYWGERTCFTIAPQKCL